MHKFIYKLLPEPKNGVIGKFLSDNTEYFNNMRSKMSGITSEMIAAGISSFLLDGGNFNGYIAVTPEHPFYGKDYDEVNDMLHKKGFYVHGGLTLASDSSFCPHLPTEYQKFWILGFDTRHADDTAAYWTEERTWEEADKLMHAAINYGE